MANPLEYVPPVHDTAWSRRKIATALPPLERVMFPTSMEMLMMRCRTIMDRQGLSSAALAVRAGLPETRVQRFLTTGDVSVGDAVRIVDALGYRLARIPAGLGSVR